MFDQFAGGVGNALLMFLGLVLLSAPALLGAVPGLLLLHWGRRRWGVWITVLGALPSVAAVAYAFWLAAFSSSDLGPTIVTLPFAPFVVASTLFVIGMFIALFLGKPAALDSGSHSARPE